MADAAELLERSPPDRTATDGLPPPLAAQIDLLAGRTDRWVDDGAPGVRARALVLAGRGAEARAGLGDLDPDGLSPAEVAAAGWAVSRVGPADLAPALTHRVVGGGDVLDDGGMVLGARDTLLGLLAATTGDLDDAVDHLRRGVAQGDGQAPVWGALARVELGRVLLDLGLDRPDGPPADDPTTEGGAALASAGMFFAAGGYRALAGQLEALRNPARAGLDGHVARPGVGVLTPTGPDGWRVGFGIQPPVEVPATKGLDALAHLVDHRDANVPAVAVDALLDGRPPVAAAPDPARGATVDDLRSTLFDDRARSRVTKLLSRTVDRLTTVHPRLAMHLREAITTGHACRYDAHPEVAWSR